MAVAADTRMYSRAELEEAAALSAGAASGVFMRAVPEMVMPSGEVSEAVGLALAELDESRSREPVVGPVADGEEFPGAGDVIAVGCGVWASADRSVLCWEGRNYVRQEPPAEKPLVPRARLTDEEQV